MPTQLELQMDSPSDPLCAGLQYADVDSAEEEERHLDVTEDDDIYSRYVNHYGMKSKIIADVPLLDNVVNCVAGHNSSAVRYKTRLDSGSLDAYLDFGGLNLSAHSSYSNMSSMQE